MWRYGSTAMDIGQRCYDSYTQYLQRVRKTPSGLADVLWQGTVIFNTFNRRAEGQEDMEEHHEYKWYKSWVSSG